MKNFIKDLLVRKFDNEADKKDFLYKNIEYNISNATRILYVIITFEILMLIRVFLTKTPPYPLYIWNYIIGYTFLLVISIINLSCVYYARCSKKDHTHLLNTVTTLYAIGFVLWGIAISICDSYKSPHIVVYLTVIVCTTSLLRLSRWLFLSLEFFGEVLLVAGMLTLRDTFASTDILNLTVFTLIFALITIVKYNNIFDDYYRNKKIDQLNGLLEDEKDRFEKAAKTDLLTGLLNRNILKEEITKRIANCYLKNIPVGIAMFDLDDFKAINDNYGHAFGDKCLVTLGNIFRNYPALTVFRYGGEEFVAICDELTEDRFTDIIECILRDIQQYKLPDAHAILTISAGYIYSVPVDETCDEKMISEADHALYTAKTSGKNCYVKATIGT